MDDQDCILQASLALLAQQCFPCILSGWWALVHRVREQTHRTICVFEWKIYIHVEIADVILTPVHQQILIIFRYRLPLKLKRPKHGI